MKIMKGVEKMPNKDKTGPEGKGAMTGLGKGDCKPKNKKLLETASNLLSKDIPKKMIISGPVKKSINKDGKVNPDDKTPEK